MQKNNFIASEHGFTIIELIITMAMIGILSGLSFSAFYIYEDDAQYSLAEVTTRNARTALEAAAQDLPEGFSMGLSFSSTEGGPVAGVMSTILPGASVPNNVRLGVVYNDCAGQMGMTLHSLLISEPCKSTKQLRWMRFCNGMEITQSEIPQAKGCP